MTIKIDQAKFMVAFAADGDYHAEVGAIKTYLDRKNGALLTALADLASARVNFGDSAVEDFLENAADVERAPGRYLEVPPMSHGQHHEVIRAFLDSQWNHGQERRNHALNVYYPRRSIGCWLREVGDQETIDLYRAFKEEEELRLAEEFLRREGVVDFQWK
jgi:hypothetical protein